MYCTILITLIILLVLCDVNYFVRSLFTILSGRIYQKQVSLCDITTIYGVCTFQDCDVWFRSLRLARLVRELDFARYHFYDRTGIYSRSRVLKIQSLQKCTLTLTLEPVPLFMPYRINTKLIYWDNCALYLEHELITIFDGRVRCSLVSCQHAIGFYGDSIEALLKHLRGFEHAPICPDYITHWLMSMNVTSSKLRPVTINQIK